MKARSLGMMRRKEAAARGLEVEDGRKAIEYSTPALIAGSVQNAVPAHSTRRIRPPRGLDRYAILSTPPEASFDRITKLASRFFGCPVALLSFVEGQRQWLKSCIGMNSCEGPRSDSFCAWAILGDQVMVVPDATADSRFSGNSWVTGVPGIRFYASAPLISPRGYKLGTLSIADTNPRPQGLSRDETEALADFAAFAISALEARLVAQESQEVRNLIQTTLSSIGDGVIVTDANSRITFLNPVAEQLTGWTLDEALARPAEDVFKIVHEISRQKVANPIERALIEDQVISLPAHTVLLARDGREIPIDDSAAPIFRGESIVGGVLIFRDIAKRRMVERALENSEDQFRATFAKAPLGLVLTHLDGRFIEANDAYRRLTRYSTEELSSISFLSLTHPDERENNFALFRRLLGGEIDSYVLEKRIFVKGGSLRWVRAHGSLLRGADGEPVRVIGLIEDITERKSAERRFHFLAESIPQMVWTATTDGMLDYVNSLGSRYFGVSQEALLGTGWLAWVHPADQAHAIERWTKSLQTGEAYETQFRLKRASDCSWRIHLVRACPFGKAA